MTIRQKTDSQSGAEFTCAACGGTFQTEWSDEEAMAEKDGLWPGVSIADCDVICDDCFKGLNHGAGVGAGECRGLQSIVEGAAPVEDLTARWQWLACGGTSWHLWEFILWEDRQRRDGGTDT